MNLKNMTRYKNVREVSNHYHVIYKDDKNKTKKKSKYDQTAVIMKTGGYED